MQAPRRAPAHRLCRLAPHGHLWPQTFPRIGPQASAAHSRHFPGQKLRLGGDVLGADPTYLLYLPSRSRGELRRIDFEPDCAGATLSDIAASELTRKPLLHTRGICRGRSFDLEVTRWAPTRLTSCIFHPGHTEAYEPLRSTLCPACAPFRYLAAPGSARTPLLHTRGISRARSFDLEVTPWAPSRLTSCISRPGPKESSGASTWSQTAQARP